MGEVGIGELRACDQQGAVGDLVCRESDLPGAERRDRYERSPQGPEPELREPSRSAGECPRSSDIEEEHGLMIPISPPPGVSSRDCEYDSAPRFAGRGAGSRIWLELNADSTMWPSALGYRMPAEWEPHEAT